MFIAKPVRDALAEALVERGFDAGRGNLFQRRSADGTSAISFVTDKWGGPPTRVRFTAHVGFLSNRLAAVFGQGALRVLAEDTVHWYRWVGYLGAGHERPEPTDDDFEPKDIMWHIPATRQAVMTEVIPALDGRALPALEAHSSDTALRDEWLEHEDPFLHRSTQASYLAVLVDALGPASVREDLMVWVREMADGGSSDAQLALAAIERDHARA